LEEICDIFVHVHHKQHALRSPGGTFRTQLRALPFFASPHAHDALGGFGSQAEKDAWDAAASPPADMSLPVTCPENVSQKGENCDTLPPAKSGEREPDYKGAWERLKSASEKVRANAYLDDNAINRHPFTTVSCKALRELFAATEAATAAPASEPPEAGEEGPARPPMLLAMHPDIGDMRWWTPEVYMEEPLWVSGVYCGLRSDRLMCVDRQLSDAAALEIYDRETAQREQPN
jgi:hypothetical protein